MALLGALIWRFLSGTIGLFYPAQVGCVVRGDRGADVGEDGAEVVKVWVACGEPVCGQVVGNGAGVAEAAVLPQVEVTGNFFLEIFISGWWGLKGGGQNPTAQPGTPDTRRRC